MKIYNTNFNHFQILTHSAFWKNFSEMVVSGKLLEAVCLTFDYSVMFLYMEFLSHNKVYPKLWSHCSINLTLSLDIEKSDAILIHILLYKTCF